MRRLFQKTITRSAENPNYWVLVRKYAGKPKDNIDPITKTVKKQEIDEQTNLSIATDIDYSGTKHGLLGNKDIDEALQLQSRGLHFVEATLTNSGKFENSTNSMVNSHGIYHGILEGQSKPQHVKIHSNGMLVRSNAIEEHIPGTNAVEQDYQKNILNQLPLPSKKYYKKQENEIKKPPIDD